VSHANASLSPEGRLLLARRVVVHGWNLWRAAKSMSCSPATSKKCGLTVIGPLVRPGCAICRHARSPRRTARPDALNDGSGRFGSRDAGDLTESRFTCTRIGPRSRMCSAVSRCRAWPISTGSRDQTYRTHFNSSDASAGYGQRPSQ
jgi:hypothetical protein